MKKIIPAFFLVFLLSLNGFPSAAAGDNEKPAAKPELPRYSAPAQTRDEIIAEEMKKQEKTDTDQEAQEDGNERCDQGKAEHKKVQGSKNTAGNSGKRP
jgi:hypothetical protein